LGPPEYEAVVLTKLAAMFSAKIVARLINITNEILLKECNRVLELVIYLHTTYSVGRYLCYIETFYKKKRQFSYAMMLL
jgi:hypothetical protein